jgi:SEC-C motif
MSSQTGRNDPCACGSGKKYKDCCGTPKLEVESMRVKDVNVFELTPGLADALSASLDHSYREYFTADCSGTSTKEAERRIGAIPEEKRYLTRVLDSLDSAFADFDTETATLDLPHMENRKPEAIKRYLEFRLQRFKMLIDAVEDYVEEKYPATGGHS